MEQTNDLSAKLFDYSITRKKNGSDECGSLNRHIKKMMTDVGIEEPTNDMGTYRFCIKARKHLTITEIHYMTGRVDIHATEKWLADTGATIADTY